jgi:hypothetical protein
MLGLLTKSTCTPLMKRLILRAQTELSRSCPRVPSAVLCWLAAAADGMDESAWAQVFSVPCRGRSLGRSAPSEPMKLPSEACIRREALAGSWAASGGPPSHPTSPFFAASAPMASWRLWRMYQGARWLHAPPRALLVAARPTRWTASQQSQLERPQSRRWWSQSAQ